MKPLYFDYNGTTPVHPRVLEAMRPCLAQMFGNPASSHGYGLPAHAALERARAQVAALIGAEAEEIVFTSCATESNATVLASFLDCGRGSLVTTPVEHPAVLEPAREYERQGSVVRLAGVDADGVLDLVEAETALAEPTDLLSVMLANNETGALQPVAEAARMARTAGAAVHTDASQAVGKIPVNVDALGVDYLTIAGHKLYAPKGVGALYVRRGAALRPLFRGGGQERGLRSGTENVAFAVGLGAACAMAAEDLATEEARQRELGARFLRGLRGLGVDLRLHAARAPRLPNTMSVAFPELAAGDILSGLVGLDVAASAGAACHGSRICLSHVLEAMGVGEEAGRGTVRFSWGRFTTAGDVDELLARLALVLRGLR